MPWLLLLKIIWVLLVANWSERVKSTLELLGGGALYVSGKKKIFLKNTKKVG